MLQLYINAIIKLKLQVKILLAFYQITNVNEFNEDKIVHNKVQSFPYMNEDNEGNV